MLRHWVFTTASWKSLLWYPFYRWANGGPERWNDFPKVTELLCGLWPGLKPTSGVTHLPRHRRYSWLWQSWLGMAGGPEISAFGLLFSKCGCANNRKPGFNVSWDHFQSRNSGHKSPLWASASITARRGWECPPFRAGMKQAVYEWMLKVWINRIPGMMPAMEEACSDYSLSLRPSLINS